MNFAASHKMQIYVIGMRCNTSLYLMRVEIVFITNDIVLFFIHCTGKMRGAKQRTELSVFLSEELHRGGVQPWDYQGQGCSNAKRKAFYDSVLHCHACGVGSDRKNRFLDH